MLGEQLSQETVSLSQIRAILSLGLLYKGCETFLVVSVYLSVLFGFWGLGVEKVGGASANFLNLSEYMHY